MQFDKAKAYILEKLEKELPLHLYYHDAAHTRDVYEACERYAGIENIAEHDRFLLLTAACYHDSGYLKKIEGHEEESCRIAEKSLAAFDYTPDEISVICGMIAATKLPQSPKTHLEQLLADADLDYLGRSDYFVISSKLYLELSRLGLMRGTDNWTQAQITFIERHQYFTDTARRLRDGQKHKNLEQIKARIHQ